MAVNSLCEHCRFCQGLGQRAPAQSLENIFRANGIPSHLDEIIKSFYDNFTCCVGDGDMLIEVHLSVRQGCAMSTPLFQSRCGLDHTANH